MLRSRMIILPTVLTVAFTAGCVHAAGNNETAALKQQIADLQARIQALESKQADVQKQMPRRKPVSRMSVFGMDPDQPDLFAQMDAMDRQMQAMMGMGPMMRGHAVSFAPDYDVKATDKAYILSFDMPGMDKSKINVEVKDGGLLVSGERSSETKEDQGGKFYRQERSFGYFSRLIPLPEDIKPESVQARYDNGVLIVTVEKKEAVKKAPEQQKIEIK